MYILHAVLLFIFKLWVYVWLFILVFLNICLCEWIQCVFSLNSLLWNISISHVITLIRSNLIVIKSFSLGIWDYFRIRYYTSHINDRGIFFIICHHICTKCSKVFSLVIVGILLLYWLFIWLFGLFKVIIIYWLLTEMILLYILIKAHVALSLNVIFHWGKLDLLSLTLHFVKHRGAISPKWLLILELTINLVSRFRLLLRLFLLGLLLRLLLLLGYCRLVIIEIFLRCKGVFLPFDWKIAKIIVVFIYLWHWYDIIIWITHIRFEFILIIFENVIKTTSALLKIVVIILKIILLMIV